ncbi:MAG TPA: PAS domain S-box protein [Thermoanaerobaculia bacterium]|nr:PAS domain S-box protein [Thermoanaerobaculia bacterium]
MSRKPLHDERAASDREGNARLRSLLQNVAATVWTIDAELRPVFIAGDTVLITGYTIDEIVQTEHSPAAWMTAVHPDDLDRVIATHAGIFRTGEPFDVEYRYRRKDGSWAWLNDRASHLYTRDGQRFVDGVTYDVTQRKVEEQQQVAAAHFGRRAVQAGDVFALLEDACETVRTALGAESCTALWLEPHARDFQYAAVAGAPVPLPSAIANDASILAGYAFRSDAGITYDDLLTETRFRAPMLVANGIRSGISAPVRGRAVRYGVISAHFMSPRRFTNRECALVETIANVSADAIERIEAEQALASVADRYAQVVESADQGICALHDGRIVFANSAVARMMGLSADVLMGRTFATLAAPREQERLAAFVESPHAATVEKIEIELAPASGPPLWAIVTRSRLAGDDTLVLITDITERVRVEQDLRRRQAQLRDAQALAHVGSFEVDLSTGAVEWSDELYRICGMEPQSRTIDLAFVQSLTPPERDGFGDGMKALAAGGSIDVVHPYLRVDGTRRTLHTRAQGIIDAQTGRRRIIGTMQDVTAELDAQAAIAEREARLQLIVSRLPVIIWSTDASLHIQSMVGAGFSAIDEERAELLGLTVPDLIGAPPTGVSLNAALQGETVSYDTWHGTRELRVHIEPLRDTLGTITGTVGIAFDRTEQLSTERVLSHIAYRAISKIADDFFRGAVLGLAEVLRVDCAFIARVGDNNILHTVAVARDGGIAPNFSYSITGTPCEQVMAGRPCWIGEHVRTLYPDDPLLQGLDAASYAGLPIFGPDGTPVGLVTVISREPLPRNAAAEAALQVYADRAAVELSRLQYEHSLVDEKEYVENLIDTANVVIIEVDAEGRIRLVNRAFEQLTGILRNAVEGEQLLDIITDASPTRHLITSGPHEMEASLRGVDGEPRLLRLRANDVRRAGRAVGTILFGIDITEERRAEQSQRRMQEQIAHAAEEWRHTFDSVLTPIIVVDAEQRVARMNRAARDLTHQSYRNVIGERLQNLGDGEPFVTATRLLANSAGLRDAINTAEAHDDRGRTWAVNAMAIASPESTRWSILVLYDITRIVALQESVRLSEQMSAMGQLVAGVAHEVRNPLFGISAALDAFEEEFGSTGDFREYLERLRTDAERLQRLMNELLEYGRPAALQLAPHPFKEVLERSVRACDPVARQRGVSLQISTGPLGTVVIDRDRLVQVFKNIVENAIAFTAPKSTVSIEAVHDVHEIVATVRDQGPGFREDDLPHVFTPFFTRRRGGTGLGLAIARRIVDDHGGSIAVSNAAGGGAVVEIRIPNVPSMRAQNVAQ